MITINEEIAKPKAEEAWEAWRHIPKPATTSLSKEEFLRIYTTAYFQGAKDTQAAIMVNLRSVI